MKTVYTTCRYCESNCALAVEVEDNRVQKITADKQNPQTWEDTCSKGLTAHELVEHPRRITAPMKRVGDEFVEVSHEQAIQEISAELNTLRSKYGKDAIAYYYGNPLGFTAGLTLSHGFFEGLKTSNLYSVGSIDQNNNHVTTQAMFGHIFVPFNPDVENSDYMLLLGMNPAESKFSWLGSVSNGWQKARDAMKARGARVVVVDPRKTRTASQASEHIRIIPGRDWAFLLGMLKVIFEQNLCQQQALLKLPSEQIKQLQAICRRCELSSLSALCGIGDDKIAEVAVEYASAKAAMCLTQTGVSMHTTGTIGHWLGLTLDIVTGHLDQKGGRHWEPGFINMTSLAKQNFKPETFSRVRKQSTVMGYRSLAELPDEIDTEGPGQPKALFIQCGNPVVSGPDGNALDAALQKLDTIIAIDLVQRESHRHAHWLIPGVHWLERGELNTSMAGGFDQPHVQYSQQALNPPEGVKQEWEFFVDLALAMKIPMLGRPGMNGMIRFSRWLARIFNKPDWAFSPDLLSRLMLLTDKKVTWKQLKENVHGFCYADKTYGGLASLMGGEKIQIAPDPFVAELERLLETSTRKDTSHEEYPLIMIGKRDLNMMNSWLMDLPNKLRRESENQCEIHPQDAARLSIKEGEMIRVRSNLASIEIQATLTDKVAPGVVCIQHGWGSRVFAPHDPTQRPTVSGVNKNVLISNKEIDPFSGTPNLNSTRVRLEAVPEAIMMTQA